MCVKYIYYDIIHIFYKKIKKFFFFSILKKIFRKWTFINVQFRILQMRIEKKKFNFLKKSFRA